MKSGDLVRHQYSGSVYLFTKLNQKSLDDQVYIQWEEGQIGVFLDDGHQDPWMENDGIARVLIPTGVGFVGGYEIERIRT